MQIFFLLLKKRKMMTTTIVNDEKIFSNNESFTKTNYNGIPILVRDKDGYINGSKIAKENGNKQLSRFLNKNTTKEMIQYLKGNNFAILNISYDLHELYKPEVQGIYIHPDLLHLLSEWVNMEYAYKVTQLMKTLNEKQHRDHIEADVNQKNIIELLNSKIKNTTVPAANCDKLLKIIKLETGKYKLSANSGRKLPGTIRTYVFAAGMNVKQLLKSLCEKYVFDDLDDMHNRILKYGPKNTIILE